MNISLLREQAARSLHSQNLQNATFGINAAPHMVIAAENWSRLIRALDTCRGEKAKELRYHMKTALPTRIAAEKQATVIAQTLGIYIDSFEY